MCDLHLKLQSGLIVGVELELVLHVVCDGEIDPPGERTRNPVRTLEV
jgi:hypothetical protein